MKERDVVAEDFVRVPADIVEMGGTGALMAAALTLVELVAAGMSEDGREYFLMEVLRAFADGTGGKVEVTSGPAVNAGGLH